MRANRLITQNRMATAHPGLTAVSLPGDSRSAGGLWARLRSWFEIPYGYEDASGFHYGQPPRPQHSAILTDRACDAMLGSVAVNTKDAATLPAESTLAKPNSDSE
jgi:hypothetical protein